jgi:hypothetical protein
VLVALPYAASLQLDAQPPDPQPSVRVTLEHAGRQVTVPALVDSGAKLSLITADLARQLGIELAGARSYRCGSAFDAHVEALDPALTLRASVDVFAIELRPHVAPLAHPWPMVLGRADFFDQLTVAFDQRAATIWLGAGNEMPVPSYEQVSACH